MAQPKSVSTIQTVLEAIKSVEDGMFWLGGTENSIIDFIMSQNYPGHYENDYDQVILNKVSSSIILYRLKRKERKERLLQLNLDNIERVGRSKEIHTQYYGFRN